LNPHNVQATRQSLHHLVAKAPWSVTVAVGKGAISAVRKGPRVGYTMATCCRDEAEYGSVRFLC